MADDTARPGPNGGVDDDRLLAYVLGLEDDPGLARAAATDDTLRRRLDDMRREVEVAEAGIHATVPLPDESYTDLSAPRWSQLQGFFAPGAERPGAARRGSRRWLRVLAPVVAVALALAVGVSVVQRQSEQKAGVDERAATASGSLSGAESAPTASPVQATLAAIHEQLDQFAVIVLATAHRATGAVQQFVVVRVFKGDPPQVLSLEVADRPADAGGLHLLMLRPVGATAQATPSPGDLATGVATATAGPSAIPSVDASGTAPGMLVTTVPVVYTFEGEMAVSRELPAHTDPASVVLP